GNDQVRFELCAQALNANLKTIAPWRDLEFIEKFKGRQDLIAYGAVGVSVMERPLPSPLDSEVTAMWMVIVISMLTSLFMGSLQTTRGEDKVLHVVRYKRWQRRRLDASVNLIAAAWKLFKLRRSKCPLDATAHRRLYECMQHVRELRLGVVTEGEDTVGLGTLGLAYPQLQSGNVLLHGDQATLSGYEASFFQLESPQDVSPVTLFGRVFFEMVFGCEWTASRLNPDGTVAYGTLQPPTDHVHDVFGAIFQSTASTGPPPTIESLLSLPLFRKHALQRGNRPTFARRDQMLKTVDGVVGKQLPRDAVARSRSQDGALPIVLQVA
ncbi:hypothetical protein DYB26_011135, partial [Aphanomyces astaci]